MVKLVNNLGEVTGGILRNEPGAEVTEGIEVGGKVRATIEELQQLSRYNVEAAQQFEQVGVRYFSDTSFFGKR